MRHVLRLVDDDKTASALRTMIRAGVVLGTAFGLQWDAAQVAATQVFVEATIQFGRSWLGGTK